MIQACIQAYRIDSLTETWGQNVVLRDNGRDVPLYPMMGNKKRGCFSSMWTKNIALSLNAEKYEGDIPLCGKKRGCFFFVRKNKEGEFPLCCQKRGPFPRIFPEEGQKRGLNVKYPPKTRAI